MLTRVIHRTLWLFLLALSSTVYANERLPENANVVRESNGIIAYRTLSAGKIRGEERFHISAHPNGSRSVSTISRYGPRDIQRHSLYRIDANLRPVDATVQYWIEGAWRASGLVTVNSTGLVTASRSPLGNRDHALAINQNFAVLTHQLSPDAWRVLLYDKEARGAQALNMYDLSPLADGPDGILGKLTTQTFEYKGQVSITVPAGTFVSDHYRLEDAIDMYVTGPDAVLVKWRFEAIDREHVLMELNQTE